MSALPGAAFYYAGPRRQRLKIEQHHKHAPPLLVARRPRRRLVGQTAPGAARAYDGAQSSKSLL